MKPSTKRILVDIGLIVANAALKKTAEYVVSEFDTYLKERAEKKYVNREGNYENTNRNRAGNY